jgi:leucyl-tRNA synthetase
MGWDAFGMPAENAAMQNKVHPREWTYANIDAMRKQLKSMGLSLDWSREFATCDVDYYKQQQALFLDFLAAGLIYRRNSKVNWDPVDMTVLANEQVIDGRGWRSGALVEQRELTQWFFRISDFAEDLLQSLDELDQWPEKVRLMQKNWIGKSEGLSLRWQIADPEPAGGATEIEVYTTRPDTLYGASFMAIAADHPIARDLAAKDPAIAEFCDQCRRAGTSLAALETAEKIGYRTPVSVIHPFDPDWTVPVYIANFVLMDYGTGAIFGCPSGDQRDLDFARKYNLPVTPVVMPADADAASFVITDEAYVGDGVMINSRELDGLAPAEAFDRVASLLEARKLGDTPQATRKTNYRLRDWGLSRQRYWGAPIPVIHCDACGVVPVPSKDLPVELPDDVTLDKPGNPLDHHPTWRHVACPACGQDARRETDTMDTFVDSSWYFARFTAPRCEYTDRSRPPPMHGCRWISISAVSSTRSCICSIPASSPAPCARPATSISRSRSAACSHRVWWFMRPIAPNVRARASGLRLPMWSSRSRMASARHAIRKPANRFPSARSRKCRNRKRMLSIPTTSSMAMGPIPHASSCCPIHRPTAM